MADAKVYSLARPLDELPYPNLAEVVTRYEVHLRTCAERTRQATGATLRKALAELPARPTEHELGEWLSRQAAPGSAGNGSRITYRTRLFSAYAYSQERWGGRNPVKMVPTFERRDVAARPLGDLAESYPAIREAMPDLRARALVASYRYTGIRPSEALGLEPEHLQGDWLQIAQQRGLRGVEVMGLKHRKQKRRVRLHPALRALLEQVAELGPTAVSVGRGGWTAASTRLLFPYSRTDIEALRDVAVRAWPPLGEVQRPWHEWRHSVALELLDGGLPLPDLSEHLGHKSVATTIGYLENDLGRRDVQVSMGPVFAHQNRLPKRLAKSVGESAKEVQENLFEGRSVFRPGKVVRRRISLKNKWAAKEGGERET
jgi:integrase